MAYPLTPDQNQPFLQGLSGPPASGQAGLMQRLAAQYGTRDPRVQPLMMGLPPSLMSAIGGLTAVQPKPTLWNMNPQIMSGMQSGPLRGGANVF